jgi:hypothetical protein
MPIIFYAKLTTRNPFKNFPCSHPVNFQYSLPSSNRMFWIKHGHTSNSKGGI